MKKALINPYAFQIPPLAKVEDFFNDGWDFARSIMWQEAGKINIAGTIGDDINTIEPIVGTKDLVWAGNVRSTVNASDSLNYVTGGANYRNYKTPSFGGISQYEFWVVMKNGSSGSYASHIANIGLFNWQDQGGTQSIYNGASANFAGTSLTNATNKLVRIIIDGASSKMYVDGVESSSGSLDTGSNSATVWGLGTGNDTTSVDWYEVWVKDGLLSSGDAAQVTTLLKTEYSIT